MKHCDNCNNLCLSTESSSQMYDKIIDACSGATRLHVPIYRFLFEISAI